MIRKLNNYSDLGLDEILVAKPLLQRVSTSKLDSRPTKRVPVKNVKVVAVSEVFQDTYGRMVRSYKLNDGREIIQELPKVRRRQNGQ